MKNFQKNILKISAVLFLALQPLAFAGQYDIKEMTPEVSRALENRKNRYSDLQSAKASGLVGENNQGLVSSLKGPTPLVSAENADRSVIYQAIVEQNGFGPGGLAQVQKAFADVQRDKARPGDFVQSSSGEWRQK